jgi:hypothetical protein
MFIENFQGTYERPSTAETLKTIKQKHDESEGPEKTTRGGGVNGRQSKFLEGT